MSNWLSKLKGYRTLIVNGLVFVTAAAAAVGVIPNPLDAATADVIANNAEAVANAADNYLDPQAVSAGVIAAFALVNLILRMVSTTPPGQKE